ncbi:MAG: hypothetical protein WBN35_07875, partial [Acidimicrobiia bacterium]
TAMDRRALVGDDALAQRRIGWSEDRCAINAAIRPMDGNTITAANVTPSVVLQGMIARGEPIATRRGTTSRVRSPTTRRNDAQHVNARFCLRVRRS